MNQPGEKSNRREIAPVYDRHNYLIVAGGYASRMEMPGGNDHWPATKTRVLSFTRRRLYRLRPVMEMKAAVGRRVFSRVIRPLWYHHLLPRFLLHVFLVTVADIPEEDKLVYISPSAVQETWKSPGFSHLLLAVMGNGSNYPQFIRGGRWDTQREPLTTEEAIDDIFVRQIPYQETAQYRYMLTQIGGGHIPWNCSSSAEVDQYFTRMITVYNEIASHGYKTQGELGGDILLELGVVIDRNGTILFDDHAQGHHRISMVKLLNLSEVPVRVTRIHYAWFVRHLDCSERDLSAAVKTSILKSTGAVRVYTPEK